MPRFLIYLLFCFLLSSCAGSLNSSQEADLYYNLGIAYTDLGKNAEAATAFNQAYALEPLMFEAGFNLARVYITLGKLDDALLLVNEILVNDPNNSLLLEVKAWIFHLQGENESALSIYRDIINRIPVSPRIFLNTATILEEMEEYEEAGEYWEMLVSEEDYLSEALFGLGRVALATNDPALSLEYLEQAQEAEPEPTAELQIALGDTYSELTLFDSALSAYTAAVDIGVPNDKSADVHFLIADLLLTKIPDLEEGQEKLKQAISFGFSDIQRLRELAADPETASLDEVQQIIADRVQYLEEQEAESTEAGAADPAATGTEQAGTDPVSSEPTESQPTGTGTTAE